MNKFHTLLGESRPDDLHEIVIAIKQHGREKLVSLLDETYRPHSPMFKKYLSRSEIDELSDHKASSAFVKEYLHSQGFAIVSASPYGEYVTASAPVDKINQLFSTRLNRYRVHAADGHRSGHSVINRAAAYSMPTDLTSHVEHVFNMDDFPPPNVIGVSPISEKYEDVHARSAASSSGDGYVTPAVLTVSYKISSNESLTLGSQCVYGAQYQNFSPEDLVAFQTEYGLPSAVISASVGGHNDSTFCTDNVDLCTEADLDVQYMLATSPYVESTYWYDNSTEYFALDWIQAVAALESPPLVLSVSYGVVEAYVSRGYAHAFDTEAIKLGLQGVTILVSSGDDGVAGYLARNDAAYCGYYPLWPATSQYVTAVGGTQGLESGKGTETGCMSTEGGTITSGGGFSNINLQPNFQSAAVSTYLNSFSKSTAPYQGSSNTYYYDSYRIAGRAYPDLSLQAAKYRVRVGKTWQIVSGTSAAAPVVAGMVALLNSLLLDAGKPSVGWMNPAIYANATHFLRDIDSGNNKCTAVGDSVSPVCCKHGK
jgi:tripeptidyl-peptidase-1